MKFLKNLKVKKLVQATRLHFGAVIKELKEGKKDNELWNQAEKLAGRNESLVVAKYLHLRAESIAKQ
ncbi:MAG: hypothetical protein CMD69_00080 [Gammaproteobacteria bacterium]|nr:hypothetical protein [Gammaproteobacteria bacterium]